MRCPNCQHDNPDTNSFCSKCASSLAKQHAREMSRTKVFIPPQQQLGSTDRKTNQSSNPSGSVVIVALMVIAIALVLFYLYG